MSSGPRSSQPGVLGFDGVNTRAPWENELMRTEWDSAERADEERLAPLALPAPRLPSQRCRPSDLGRRGPHGDPASCSNC